MNTVEMLKTFDKFGIRYALAPHKTQPNYPLFFNEELLTRRFTNERDKKMYERLMAQYYGITKPSSGILKFVDMMRGHMHIEDLSKYWGFIRL